MGNTDSIWGIVGIIVFLLWNLCDLFGNKDEDFR